ncbi:MAG: flippase-like domain-containing protein [Cytophagales bacterium]|nr:flippase-like domain-containing protein [Cytophagales bacterium]MDW8384690.1 lysylphosphatidylglycerol synthase transmembrane domain-containing protein [Flammeovirgaceae bacterium]
MQQKLFSIFKYLISSGIAIALFWYIYRDQNFDEMLNKLQYINPKWIYASVIISLLSHLSRAQRWTIALKPLGYSVYTFHAFLCVMVGYFVNLFVPRAGEVARCSLLKKLDNVPVANSFGTVVAERTIDLIILGMLTIVVITIEFDRLGNFLLGNSSLMIKKLPWLIGLALVGILALIAFFRLRHWLEHNRLLGKLYHFIDELLKGLLSIFRLQNNLLSWYIFHSFLIWIFYYLMAYVLFFSMEETSSLGMMCCLTVLVMGSIGVIIPTPGGIGSYHFFVSTAFLTYQISESIGEYFAFLMHTSQTLAILCVGGISFAIAFLKNFKR